MKIEIDYETADIIVVESLKESMLLNANQIMRSVIETVNKEGELHTVEVDDLVDSVLLYATLASALRYHMGEEDWRAVVREHFGYEREESD